MIFSASADKSFAIRRYVSWLGVPVGPLIPFLTSTNPSLGPERKHQSYVASAEGENGTEKRKKRKRRRKKKELFHHGSSGRYIGCRYMRSKGTKLERWKASRVHLALCSSGDHFQPVPTSSPCASLGFVSRDGQRNHARHHISS